jgi:hypothetical protein
MVSRTIAVAHMVVQLTFPAVRRFIIACVLQYFTSPCVGGNSECDGSAAVSHW